jgi:hypothetical protein
MKSTLGWAHLKLQADSLLTGGGRLRESCVQQLFLMGVAQLVSQSVNRGDDLLAGQVSGDFSPEVFYVRINCAVIAVAVIALHTSQQFIPGRKPCPVGKRVPA